MTFRKKIVALVVVMLCHVSLRCQAQDVVVVCHVGLRDALQPWTDLRTKEGLEVVYCEPEESAERTFAAVAELAKPSTQFVFLVGDAPSIGQARSNNRSTQIPTFYRPSLVTGKHGSTPTYPTDSPYGDFDRDGINDAAVGRLPSTSPEQLSAYVNRVVAYETSSEFGPWRQCLQLTAGVGGFGMLVDGAIEAVTRTVLTSALPSDVKPQIAYASPGHAFCPTGEAFQDCVMKRYRDGARFWIYAGHGSVDRLDLLQRSANDHAGLQNPGDVPTPQWEVESLLTVESVSLLNANQSRPTIGLLLACYAGAYDAPAPSLSERMLLTPGGPIIMIAASRLTMPYGNARFGLGLLESVYGKPNADDAFAVTRIGDAVLAAQRKLQSEQTGSTTQAMVDGVASMISPAGSNLADERSEHAGLFQLLGDPTLHLQSSSEIQLQAKSDASQPNRIELNIQSLVSGTITLSVDQPLGTQNPLGAKLKSDHDPHGCTIAQTTLKIDAGQPLATQVDLPVGFSGPVIIRGFVQNANQWASGATKLYVRER